VKKITFKILISTLLFFIFAAPSYSKGVYILCYHAFLEKKDPYSFSNDQFRDQLNRLKNDGFKFVSFEDVINNRIAGNKNILVSIDDGNKSVYQAYYSIMKPMGIKPLLGIYPAIISRMHYAMTWEEVKKLADEGCYIASHGYHHMFLSEKYYKEDPASFKKEIYLSKKILEEKLNRKIETMVYPFGVNSATAISELKNAGYKYGMTIEPKMASLPINDNFQINRYLMTKPGQKGVIAFISKNAKNQQADNSQDAVNTVNYADEKNSRGRDKLSIISYPERIKKIMADDIILTPVSLETDKKKNVKFKPFVHTSRKQAGSKKNGKKITAKNEKKNHRKKKPV
jgi:peptidoglycan/xylan/chitin deacetylase (PgdA/CDA1 family)